MLIRILDVDFGSNLEECLATLVIILIVENKPDCFELDVHQAGYANTKKLH